MKALFERYYYRSSSFVDGTTHFHRTIQEISPAKPAILETGAGASNRTSAFLATVGRVTGIDISETVLSNEHPEHARKLDGREFPFAAEAFDICVSNFLIEHADDPPTHFLEADRVLKPGGAYVFRTPNLWHYVALCANMTPHSIHLLIANRLRGLDAAVDPFPTFYRANTRSTIRRLCAAASFRRVEMTMLEREPSYGRSSQLLFWPMLAYERVVNVSDHLQGFRSNIIGIASK